MTTDTRPKIAVERQPIGGREVTLLGLANEPSIALAKALVVQRACEPSPASAIAPRVPAG